MWVSLSLGHHSMFNLFGKKHQQHHQIISLLPWHNRPPQLRDFAFLLPHLRLSSFLSTIINSEPALSTGATNHITAEEIPHLVKNRWGQSNVRNIINVGRGWFGRIVITVKVWWIMRLSFLFPLSHHLPQHISYIWWHYVIYFECILTRMEETR